MQFWTFKWKILEQCILNIVLTLLLNHHHVIQTRRASPLGCLSQICFSQPKKTRSSNTSSGVRIIEKGSLF